MNKTTYQNSILSRWFIGIMSNQKAFTGSCVILIFALIAIFLPFFIQSPTDFLGTPLSPPSLEYIFGTNGQGQDVFAQTICGARQTLLVGFGAGILVVIIGALIGGIAGFYGGRTDDILSCLLYTSPSPRDGLLSRMPSSA